MSNSLKEARSAQGLTQVQLAAKSDVSVSIINQLERETRADVKLSTMRRIADALDKPVEEVFSSFFNKKF